MNCSCKSLLDSAIENEKINKTLETIVVTGVSGFIGGTIAKYLAKRHKVIGIYRKNKPKDVRKTENLTLLQDDLVKPKNLPIFCDYLVHTAA